MTTDIDPRQITYVPLDDLKPDPRNPKNHDVDTIDASVGRFGVLDLIVQDGRTGYTITGHGRTKVLNRMAERGEDPPEGVLLDDAGRWLIPVVTGWSSRSDTEAAAALIALNRTTEKGGWNDASLLALLDDLADIEDGLDGVGYSEKDIDDLHEKLAALEDDADFDPDDDGTDPRLDRKSVTTCPECGHTFTPITRSEDGDG